MLFTGNIIFAAPMLRVRTLLMRCTCHVYIYVCSCSVATICVFSIIHVWYIPYAYDMYHKHMVQLRMLYAYGTGCMYHTHMSIYCVQQFEIELALLLQFLYLLQLYFACMLMPSYSTINYTYPSIYLTNLAIQLQLYIFFLHA